MKTKVTNKKHTMAQHKKWLDTFRSETVYPSKKTKRKKGKK
ncbi:hypothetical protein [uncultured Mediterranean phage uvMED]|nr:hypothetical protein [uncultured Mediterranean phage uvMED]BAR17612.1 hypothetical protein [uncultured Mediterranean phage uvMED]